MPESAPGILQRHQSTTVVLTRILDSLLILFTLWLANLSFQHQWNQRLTLVAVIAIGFFILVGESSELYRSWPRSSMRQLVAKIAKVWLVTVALLFVLGWATKMTGVYSRLVMGTWLLIVPLLLIFYRYLIDSFLQTYLKSGRNRRRVAIVGLTQSAKQVFDEISNGPSLGLKVVGVFADSGKNRRSGERDWEVEVSGSIDELCKRAKNADFDVIYIALRLREEKRIADILESLADSTASVYLVPEFFVSNLMQMRWSTLGSMPTISVVETPFYGVDGWLKRWEDLLLGGVLLAMAALPMLVIATGIKLTSKGPVFFRQMRYGLDGRKISVWKFRSMTVCEDGREVVQAQKDDSRVTNIGRLLRRTSLDELPQFFNVLRGDMSIVGPRPHAVAHNEQYRSLIRGYMIRHKVKPGITGWAQINGWRGETDTLEKMKKRIDYDLWYIQNWSVWLDIKIMFLTVISGISGENAY
jgi:putative colanic acid biosynthesis UDP-glucose lipid carrier transferase